jgi:sulfur-carrier protein
LLVPGGPHGRPLSIINKSEQYVIPDIRRFCSMATVRLAPILRQYADKAKQVTAEGATLAEVLSDLYQRYPALKNEIQQDGELSRYINVYVNDQDVRYLQGLSTTVGPNDTVILLPAMAGGGQ